MYVQREYAGMDFRERPTQLKCKGQLNPTFCCGVEGRPLLYTSLAFYLQVTCQLLYSIVCVQPSSLMMALPCVPYKFTPGGSVAG